MAAIAPTPAQAELISTLTQDEIPIKLRCAICSKLAVNAFRLPCCDQAICETCQSALPSSCPVCEHSPVAAEDCKPHKSLRTTIRVFLRTEEKKRETLRIKEEKNTPPITPIDAVPSVPLVKPVVPPALESREETPGDAAVISDAQNDEEQAAVIDSVDASIPLEENKDVPQQSIEEIAPGQEGTDEMAGEHTVEATYGVGNGDGVVNAGDGGLDGELSTEQASQTPSFPTGFSFDASTGGFPNMGAMGLGGDFNQMQMMMAMQNGMGANSIGGFPMGMQGMSMDPMAMQNMFMNGGFGGMGMNGMNMGMGMGGFDVTGSGFNNGWNGQQSWNMGQDNLNHPTAAGMGHGDFGANNSGFNRPNAAGFNQGNYGRHNQFNDFQQNGYGYRGRGRGRGGYGYAQGRGGYGYGQNGYSSQQYSQNFQDGQGTDGVGESNSTDATDVPPSNVDEFGREIRDTSPTKAVKDTTDIADESTTAEDKADKEHNTESAELGNQDQNGTTPSAQVASALPSSFSTAGFNSPVIASWGMQNQMGYQVDPGYMQQPQNIQSVVQVPDVPINAPKGPKAMRDGLPNTSLHFLRGRGGYPNIGRADSRTNGSQSEATPVNATSRSRTPEPETVEPEEDRDRVGLRSRARSERSESGDDSREDGRERYRERRRHRHRSGSISGGDKEDDRRREHRHRRSRKHEDDEGDGATDNVDARDEAEPHTRSQSPAESRRSGHRSRRDRDGHSERHRDRERDREKDKDRGKDRDSEREHKSSSSKHRSSRHSHRDRSRSTERHSHRDRDRDRSREHRHRRRREDSTESRRERHSDRDRERERHRDKDKDRESRREKDKPLDAVAETSSTSNQVKPNMPLEIPRGPRAMTSTVPTMPRAASSTVSGIRGAHARRQSVQDEVRATVNEKSLPTSRSTQNEDRERRDKEKRERGKADTSKDERRKSTISEATSKKIDVDPHQLEREKRNRERLLKEAQRMAGMAGMISGGLKRSRDDGKESSSGGIGKKKRRSEIDGSGLEDRIARGESERESARWG